MSIAGIHPMADFVELWSFQSFRARIFFAIVPTILAVLFGYFALDRNHPYEFLAEGSYIVPSSGRGGDQVTVNWKVIHNRTCTGIVERQLVDPETDVVLASYDAAPAALNGVAIGNDYLRKTFLLPRSINPGWIGYHAKLTYHCNWLQSLFPNALAIKYTTPMLLFKVEQ